MAELSVDGVGILELASVLVVELIWFSLDGWVVDSGDI